MKTANLIISYLNKEEVTCLVNHEVKARDRHDSIEQGHIFFASDKFKGCKLVGISSDLK